jgi:hypothetical protein
MADGFGAALLSLSGSKESIRGAAEFFETHSGHAQALASLLCTRAVDAVHGVDVFTARQRLLFVANDAVFAAQRRADGSVLAALQVALPPLFALSFEAARGAEDVLKMASLLEFWRTRGVVDAAVAAQLHACLAPRLSAVAAPPLDSLPPPLHTLPPPLPPPPPPHAPPPVLAGALAFRAGVIPSLVRKRRAPPYTPLALEDVLSPAEVPHAAEAYLAARLERFAEDLQHGG